MIIEPTRDSAIPDDLVIDGVAWRISSYIGKLSSKDLLRLLMAPEAILTITSDWKIVLQVPLAEVPTLFYKDEEFREIKPVIPVRTTRADAPAWARIIYSITKTRKAE